MPKSKRHHIKHKIVYLIGAGPGGEDLITVKGLNCLKQADVILYDRLVSKNLLKNKKKTCRLICVGKSKGKHTYRQEQINDALLRNAANYKVVVRLKGGDPFIFGRGYEEAEILTQHGFNVEVVPGVSSFYSVPELCNIPLTRRGVASQFMVVTGHEDPTKEKRDVDWKHIAQFKGTIVILMGKSNLKEIVTVLQKNGKASTTPCAVISQGSTRQQQYVTTTLKNIVQRSKHVPAPAVIIIGDVVSLKENNPASLTPSKQRYLITASRILGNELSSKLLRYQANVDCVPMVRISPNKNCQLLDSIIKNIETYDWLVFTSRYGVQYFLKRFVQLNADFELLHGRIACVGSGTANEFYKYGINHLFLPKEFTTYKLATALKRKGVKNKNIALLRTQMGKDMLKDMLLKSGANITECIVYTSLKTKSRHTLTRALSKKPNGVFFLSPKSVENFFELHNTPIDNQLSFYSIGPVTTEALRQRGMHRIIEPKLHTIDGLVDATQKANIENAEN